MNTKYHTNHIYFTVPLTCWPPKPHLYPFLINLQAARPSQVLKHDRTRTLFYSSSGHIVDITQHLTRPVFLNLYFTRNWYIWDIRISFVCFCVCSQLLGKAWTRLGLELIGPLPQFGHCPSKAPVNHRGVGLNEVTLSTSNGASSSGRSYPQQPSHTQAEQTHPDCQAELKGISSRHFIE